MNKEKVLKISWYIFLAAMSILTVLFFLDIKFVVVGINILVLDALTAGIWIFVYLCKWAGHGNTDKRLLAVIAITLAGLFAAAILLFGLAMYGAWYEYAEETEPQTHRTFVVEYQRNMLQKGTAKVYERFGPLLFPCDVPEYSGPLNFDELDADMASVYISEGSQAIVVSLFIYGPRFYVPLELPEGTAKTPGRLLLEQPKDDTHDAFLIDTKGELGTLLITVEKENSNESTDFRFILHFSVWNPAHMDTPLQTMTAGSDCFQDSYPTYHTLDANFDGYMDFGYTFARGNIPYYDHLWVWNETQRQFVNIPEFDKIPAPELDAETKTIYGFARESHGTTGSHTFHQWVEGNLVCMRQIDIYGIDQSDTVRMSIWDRVAGGLAEIYHEDFPSESGGWLDAQMVWYDLDYHGEPGGIYDIFQQQPIDDTHDAFLVSTGGELGTLLVTAELTGRSEDESGVHQDITFSVWNPMEMEQPIQTFSEKFYMGVAPEFHYAVDANFDGFQDFGYLYFLGNQPNYCHYWLWDEEQAQFIYCAPLAEVSQAVFDAEQQIVTGWARSSGAGDGLTTFYRWEDGELVCVRQIISHCPWGEATTVSVEDRIDGELQQVYYEEFSWPGDKPEGQEDWRRAVRVWSDLDYHGESTEDD